MRRLTPLLLVLSASSARADAPVDNAQLLVKAYQVLTGPKHILPTDAKAVAQAAVEALSPGSGATAGVGPDATTEVALLERLGHTLQARADVWAAIRAMTVATGDPHTFLFDPSLGPTLTALVEGKPAAGSGATFARLADGRIVVGEVQPGSPAEKAGMKRGDVLAKIDGRVPTSLSDIFILVGRTNRPPIPVTIQRPGSRKLVEVKYRAFEWTQPNVSGGRLLAGKIGYLRFRFFSTTAPDLIRKQLDALGRGGARALILDIRGNWGGIPDAVPSIFTDGDPIVILRDGTGKEEPLRRTGSAWSKPLPLLVLVDGGTYSAAEFLAYSLQDRKAAVVVGTPTGGGLTGVDDVELADGYVLHVANTLVLGPVSHRASSGHRVVPDKPLAERTPEELAAGVDRQLEAALAEAMTMVGRPGDRR
jgi:carboxyl-terminal processing protease